VKDDAKSKRKEFLCSRTVLVAHMKYFEKFLSQTDFENENEICITVHCDLEVFEWLMAYVHQSELEKR
jgi:hypothetical protein